MKILVACLDVKTETFLAPIACVTRGEAERIYAEIIQSPETLVGKHPRDFPLYEIGTYDEKSGQVRPLLSEDGIAVLPRLLIEAATILKIVKEA